MEAHAGFDPLVGDALGALKYDTFLRDACRVLEAAKLGEIRRCDSIDVSSVREWCRATVAEVTSDADSCPWVVEGRVGLGRDPSCVAIALRDDRFCAAVAQDGGYERSTCVAVASHDAAACKKLRSPADEGRCRSLSERWRALVTATPGVSAGAPPFVVSGAVHLDIESANSGSADVVDIDLGLDPGVARGVVVSIESGALHFDIGTLANDALEFIAPSPVTRVRFGVALRIEAAAGRSRPDSTATIAVDRVSLRLPGRAPLETALAHSTWTGTTVHVAAVRGAPVEVRMSGTVSNAAETVHVRAEIHSFVRDIVRDRERP